MQKSIRAATQSLKASVVLPGLVHSVVSEETKAQAKIAKQKTNHLENWKPDFAEHKGEGVFTFRSDRHYDLPPGITPDMLKSQNGVSVGNSEGFMKSTIQKPPTAHYISSSQEKLEDDFSTTVTEHTTQFGGGNPQQQAFSSSGGPMSYTSPSLSPKAHPVSSSSSSSGNVDPNGVQGLAIEKLERSTTFKSFLEPCIEILTQCHPLPSSEMKRLQEQHKDDPSKLGDDFWATICWHSTIDRLNKECRDTAKTASEFKREEAKMVLDCLVEKYDSYDKLPDWVVTELLPRRNTFVKRYLEAKFESNTKGEQKKAMDKLLML